MTIKTIDVKKVLFKRNNYLFCNDRTVYEKIDNPSNDEDIYILIGISGKYKKLTKKQSDELFAEFVSDIGRRKNA